MALFAVARPVDGITGIAQGARQLSAEIRIVLDDEYPHTSQRPRTLRTRPDLPSTVSVITAPLASRILI